MITVTDFKRKNTVGWTADNMQEHVWNCHKEIDRLRLENNLWAWIHEEMGCFVQHSATLDDACKWVVLDVDHDVVAEGSSPIEAMKDAERIYKNNLEGEMP
jgi:hypothetical protein